MNVGLPPELATIAVAAATAEHKAPLKPPKLFLSGFPKAGTHLADRMAVAMLKPFNPEYNWFGTNAWTEDLDMENLEIAAFKLGAIKNGEFIKGHLSYLPSLEMLLKVLGFGLLFVYRDLRDVVVSMAYHIMSDKVDDLIFPWRDEFEGMTKEEIMLRVVTGHGHLDGVFERWETFAPWLDCDWILPMPFEEMRLKRERAAQSFFDYVFALSLKESGVTGSMTNERTKRAVIGCILTEMGATQMSVTFRKGKTGGWKKEFTPEITAAFKEADKNNWLVRLGYEQDKDW